MKRDAAVVERLGIIRPGCQSPVVKREGLSGRLNRRIILPLLLSRFGVIRLLPQNRCIVGERLVEAAEVF